MLLSTDVKSHLLVIFFPLQLWDPLGFCYADGIISCCWDDENRYQHHGHRRRKEEEEGEVSQYRKCSYWERNIICYRNPVAAATAKHVR